MQLNILILLKHSYQIILGTLELFVDIKVFIREVISNASDALERLRCLQATGEQVDESHPMEIRISTDNASGTITLQVLRFQ